MDCILAFFRRCRADAGLKGSLQAVQHTRSSVSRWRTLLGFHHLFEVDASYVIFSAACKPLTDSVYKGRSRARWLDFVSACRNRSSGPRQAASAVVHLARGEVDRVGDCSRPILHQEFRSTCGNRWRTSRSCISISKAPAIALLACSVLEHLNIRIRFRSGRHLPACSHARRTVRRPCSWPS